MTTRVVCSYFIQNQFFFNISPIYFINLPFHFISNVFLISKCFVIFTFQLKPKPQLITPPPFQTLYCYTNKCSMNLNRMKENFKGKVDESTFSIKNCLISTSIPVLNNKQWKYVFSFFIVFCLKDFIFKIIQKLFLLKIFIFFFNPSHFICFQ